MRGRKRGGTRTDGGRRDPASSSSSTSSLLVLILDRADSSPQTTSLTFSRDGKYLFIGNETGQVEVWDVETMVKIRTMKGHVVSSSSSPLNLKALPKLVLKDLETSAMG